MNQTARIGITIGDPAGIGPEIALTAAEALAARVRDGLLSMTLIGTGAALAACAQSLGKAIVLAAPDTTAAWPVVPFAEATSALAPVPTGTISAEAGRQAYHAVAHAVALAQAGTIDAVVTAPLNKEALNLAGFHYAGHTDMMADLTGSRDSCMMLAHGGLRVSHISTHVPLARAASLLTRERLDRVLTLTMNALADLGISRPRVAVAALNPHAGEGGIFGMEDISITTPAVLAWRARGFDVTGPAPGDTVFVKAAAGQFDAVVAMYHDQGHIPVKLLGFHIDSRTQAFTDLSGVNVTLGLPIIRTSVDHGTAFDIAGQGIANAQSMIEAITLAEALVRRRRP